MVAGPRSSQEASVRNRSARWGCLPVQEPIRPKSGPTVVHIRVRGRTLTFAAGVTLVALLPFIGGSAPQVARQSVVLAAGASGAAPSGTPEASAPAFPQGASADLAGAMSGISSAIGGGLFQQGPDLLENCRYFVRMLSD